MASKTLTPSAPHEFRYEPDDVTPRDVSADEKSMDAYLKRNAKAIDESVDEAMADLENGACISLDEALAAVAEQARRRRSGPA